MYPEGFQEVVRYQISTSKERNNHFIYDEAGWELGEARRAGERREIFKQIIQFEIVLRDTPLISHNDCLSFVDIMLNVLFA